MRNIIDTCCLEFKLFNQACELKNNMFINKYFVTYTFCFILKKILREKGHGAAKRGMSQSFDSLL